jgi:hypothetical protein
VASLKHPSSHEAGHVVVALSIGFVVDGIEVFEGRFRTMCQLDALDRTDNERFIFLAGGIAGEKIQRGHYFTDGCADDQQKISERGGESIETYLPYAVTIIDAYPDCFRKFTDMITKRAIERAMEMALSGGKNSFKLIPGKEILQIWIACQSPK